MICKIHHSISQLRFTDLLPSQDLTEMLHSKHRISHVSRMREICWGSISYQTMKEACLGVNQNESWMNSLSAFTLQNAVQNNFYWWFILIHIWALSFSLFGRFYYQQKFFYVCCQFCFLRGWYFFYKNPFHTTDIHFWPCTHFKPFLGRITLFIRNLLPCLDIIFTKFEFMRSSLFPASLIFLTFTFKSFSRRRILGHNFALHGWVDHDLFNTQLMRLDYRLKVPSNSGCQLQMWRLINTK